MLESSDMRRFGLAIIVVVLTFSASGLSALVIAEPCTGYEQSGGSDGVCPPTCVTCGCCAQAAEPAVLLVANTPDTPAVEPNAFVPRIPTTGVHKILHVPKPHLS
jgi:hypothetical protein